MEQEMGFDYDNAALTDVCDDLSQHLGINMRLDERRLEEAGINIDTAIRCNFPAAALRVQLRRLCDALEMDFTIRHETLWLTSREATEGELTTRIFDVRPLVDPDVGLGSEDELLELVTTHIEPESWDEVGGPGSITCFRGLMVVSQVPEMQRMVAGLLTQLENRCLRPDSGAANQPVAHVSADPADARIEEALARPIDIALQEVSLDEAMRELSAKSAVPIAIDFQHLREIDMRERRVFSLAARQMPLERVLGRLLEPFGLAFAAWNGAVLVSDWESSSQARLTRLYRFDPAASRERDLELFHDSISSDLSSADAVLHRSTSLLGGRWRVVSADRKGHERWIRWSQKDSENPTAWPAGIISELQQELLPAAFEAPDPAVDDPLHSVYLTGSCRLSIVYRDKNPTPSGMDPFAAAADAADPFASQP
jgi:hypothetical protein